MVCSDIETSGCRSLKGVITVPGRHLFDTPQISFDVHIIIKPSDGNSVDGYVTRSST